MIIPTTASEVLELAAQRIAYLDGILVTVSEIVGEDAWTGGRENALIRALDDLAVWLKDNPAVDAEMFSAYLTAVAERTRAR